MDAVTRLRPITFTRKETGRRGIGLAAEEVKEVEPLLTFDNERGEVEGVRYELVGAVLINAIKEQQAQIERLQEVVARQKSQLRQQRAQIDQVKRAIRLRRAAKR